MQQRQLFISFYPPTWSNRLARKSLRGWAFTKASHISSTSNLLDGCMVITARSENHSIVDLEPALIQWKKSLSFCALVIGRVQVTTRKAMDVWESISSQTPSANKNVVLNLPYLLTARAELFIACEQALLFGRAKRASRERVLARLVSLAQTGELARRLSCSKLG